MNNYGSEEDKLKNENSPNKLSLNRSLTNISLDEQLIGKRMKNNTKNNLKSNQPDKNIERKIFDTNKKDVELKKFQIDKCLKDIETTVIEKEKRRNVMLQNEFDKERNYLIDQQKSVKTQIEDVSRNNMNEKIIKMLKEGVSYL